MQSWIAVIVDCRRQLLLMFVALALPALVCGQLMQQARLVGEGAVGMSFQGLSVALSADGNTALVGGPGDNGPLRRAGPGAAWVWFRSGGTWTQQGPKLAAVDAVGLAEQGRSVALSADGNTAIVGGPGDRGQTGAAWVWVRSGGVWTQQAKLTPNDAAGVVLAGYSVALSADGNTALAGGPGPKPPLELPAFIPGPIPEPAAGAAWVWTRSNGVWTQQGPKLVGSGASGPSNQGDSVALSADGNTALVGGSGDRDTSSWDSGAVWVWTRSGGAWTQQGPKLSVLTVGARGQGASVALSADGNTALIGGPSSHSGGAVWTWTRSGGAWSQHGPALVGDGAVGFSSQGSSVTISADGISALVGGPSDDPFPLTDTGAYKGASWYWALVGGVWTQQGPKLVGRGAVNPSWCLQGTSVALSADGRTALVGGPLEPWGSVWEGPPLTSTGAAWVFSRVVDASAQTSVTVSEFARGRERGHMNWTAVLTVTALNRSPGRDGRAAPIPAPIIVALTNLSPNATMLNYTNTYQGSPYIVVSNEPLIAGNTVSVTIEFANSTGGPITFTPVTYSGPY